MQGHRERLALLVRARDPREAEARLWKSLQLHLPFPVLSDEKLALTRALNLPTMEVAGLTLIKRLALIIDDAKITHVFYPVFPPDRNAGDVLDWLKANPAEP